MAPRLEIDRRTLRMIAIAFVLLSALTVHRLWFAETPSTTDVLVVNGETMGTTYEIRVAGEGLDDRLQHAVEQQSEARLAEIDRWMSNWNPDSEVSGFNRHHETTGFAVSHETAAVVAFAVELGKWSGGAFDITVGPLVSLWGFGHGARIGEPPTQEEIDETLSPYGRTPAADRPRLTRRAGGFLRKNDPAVQIDLSAIAKGYGVDHLASGLLALGREDFLVEIGGEVYAAGERPGGGPWRVAIEQPREEGRSIQAIVGLPDLALATSGDYRIFYRQGDRTHRPHDRSADGATGRERTGLGDRDRNSVHGRPTPGPRP